MLLFFTIYGIDTRFILFSFKKIVCHYFLAKIDTNGKVPFAIDFLRRKYYNFYLYVKLI